MAISTAAGESQLIRTRGTAETTEVVATYEFGASHLYSNGQQIFVLLIPVPGTPDVQDGTRLWVYDSSSDRFELLRRNVNGGSSSLQLAVRGSNRPRRDETQNQHTAKRNRWTQHH